jgi:hypothetical protein
MVPRPLVRSTSIFTLVECEKIAGRREIEPRYPTFRSIERGYSPLQLPKLVVSWPELASSFEFGLI